MHCTPKGQQGPKGMGQRMSLAKKMIQNAKQHESQSTPTSQMTCDKHGSCKVQSRTEAGQWGAVIWETERRKLLGLKID